MNSCLTQLPAVSDCLRDLGRLGSKLCSFLLSKGQSQMAGSILQLGLQSDPTHKYQSIAFITLSKGKEVYNEKKTADVQRYILLESHVINVIKFMDLSNLLVLTLRFLLFSVWIITWGYIIYDFRRKITKANILFHFNYLFVYLKQNTSIYTRWHIIVYNSSSRAYDIFFCPP